MKKWIAISLTAAVILILAHNRNRLFVRDPLGSVMRGGIKEDGAQVYVNFLSEALIENDNSPMYVFLVQHNGHAGSPVELHCLRWLLCMTDADAATLLQPAPAIAVEEMTGKSIRFLGTDKRETVVRLH